MINELRQVMQEGLWSILVFRTLFESVWHGISHWDKSTWHKLKIDVSGIREAWASSQVTALVVRVSEWWLEWKRLVHSSAYFWFVSGELLSTWVTGAKLSTMSLCFGNWEEELSSELMIDSKLIIRETIRVYWITLLAQGEVIVVVGAPRNHCREMGTHWGE